ncbi:hypothetical protein NCT62_004625, partial [Escherichia coli]|nr:hypothetical protein [Escherichia coli]
MDKNDNYTWTSNQSWVVARSDGSFIMTSKPGPSSTNVVITAKPKEGGETLYYKFNIRQWFYLSGATNYPMIPQVCTESNSIAADFEQVTTVFPGDGSAKFETGTLFGEWQGFIGPAWVSNKPDNNGYVYYINNSNGSVRLTNDVYMLLPALCLTNL